MKTTKNVEYINTLIFRLKNAFFWERSEQLFAQLFKFDSSASFRNRIPYYLKYIVTLWRK